MSNGNGHDRSDLPAPLTPSDCDLHGYDWMKLMCHRLFESAWYRSARKDGRGGIASLKLWWVAMLQSPAGSLPNDEQELCMLADFGEDMRAWRKHREVAMHGFFLCSDNRWYHKVVAEQVKDAYNRKLKAAVSRQSDADRLRRWRAANHAPPETAYETRFTDRFDPRFETADSPSETRFETSRASDSSQERKKGRSTPYPTEAAEAGTPAAPGTPPGRRPDGTNPRAVGTNPRKTGDNLRSWGANPRQTGTNPRSSRDDDIDRMREAVNQARMARLDVGAKRKTPA